MASDVVRPFQSDDAVLDAAPRAPRAPPRGALHADPTRGPIRYFAFLVTETGNAVALVAARCFLRSTQCVGQPRFVAEYQVESLWPLDVAVPPRHSFDDIAAAVPRASPEARVLGNVTSVAWRRLVIALSAEVLEPILRGENVILESRPVTSKGFTSAAPSHFHAPCRRHYDAAFRAWRASTSLSGISLRRVMPAKIESARHRLLWTISARWLRNKKTQKEAVAAALSALIGDFNRGEEMMENEKMYGQRSLLRGFSRIDATSCLLQRLELRQASYTVHVVCDGPPKFHAECFGASMRLVRASGEVEAVAFPGATLRHGGCGLLQKTFVLLWQIWLVSGPSLKQLRRFLDSVRSVTTDMGTEMGIADSKCCVEAWYHWAFGGMRGNSPGVDDCKFLFPKAVWIPGWNHLWSNTVMRVCEMIEGWPGRLFW